MTHTNKYNLLIILSLLLAPINILWAKDYQSISSIQSTITNFIETNIDSSIEHEIFVKRIDSRLNLDLCSTPLEAYSHNNEIKAGKLSIGVRCNGTKKWSLFHTAKLTFYQDVLVLKQTLRRNMPITRDHVILTKKSTTKLHRGYFTSVQQIHNQLATRNLRAGDILQPSHLTSPKLIKKGEQVIILAASPSFSIKMAGKALSSGGLGEIIRVKNIRSKKIIEGTITRAGTISVNF